MNISNTAFSFSALKHSLTTNDTLIGPHSASFLLTTLKQPAWLPCLILFQTNLDHSEEGLQIQRWEWPAARTLKIQESYRRSTFINFVLYLYWLNSFEYNSCHWTSRLFVIDWCVFWRRLADPFDSTTIQILLILATLSFSFTLEVIKSCIAVNRFHW